MRAGLPQGEEMTCVRTLSGKAAALRLRAALRSSDTICGMDDSGRFYSNLAELHSVQTAERAQYKLANEIWWADGGYGGCSTESAMIGDEGSAADVLESVKYLDDMHARLSLPSLGLAVDAGAGAGRVTKHVLLPRCRDVVLVEADPCWSALSQTYVGAAAERCRFVQARLEELTIADLGLTDDSAGGTVDLVWVQWCLQYLTDADAIRSLCTLAQVLRAPHGVMLVKENRPFHAGPDPRLFRMSTPSGPKRRYNITRPDAHHRYLFQVAGLEVLDAMPAGETCFWTLRKISPASGPPAS
jgi:hypothetical protein